MLFEASRTSTANRSNRRLNLEWSSAQGTPIVFDPCSLHMDLGIRQVIVVMNCMVSRCLHERSSRWSWMEQDLPHTGHGTGFPESHSTRIWSVRLVGSRFTDLTTQGWVIPRSCS